MDLDDDETTFNYFIIDYENQNLKFLCNDDSCYGVLLHYYYSNDMYRYIILNGKSKS